MKKISSVILIAPLVLVLLSAWAYAFEHSLLYDSFVGVDVMDGKEDGIALLLTSELCACCHNEKIDEIMQTVHYTLQSENKNIGHPGGGSHGHMDRHTAITGGNAMINYYFDSEIGCGRCHVGKYLPGTMNEKDLFTGLPTENMKKVRNGIDCLICHSSVYDGRDSLVQEITADGQLETYWYQDRTWIAVGNIGKTTTENCLRCHSDTGTSEERGTPFEAWNDVHIASENFRGNACTRCHTVDHHKIVRGNYSSDIFASDYKVGSKENELKCEKCHGNTPHGHGRKNVLNRHIERIACQTCHIPWTSGGTYYSWQSDGIRIQYAREDRYSAFDTRPYITEGKIEREIWEEYKMRPKYMWFNGKASYIAQPFGSRNDLESKIWPFKPVISGLPFDMNNLSMVDMLDDATIQRAMVSVGAMIPGEAPEATATTGIGILDNRTIDSSLSIEMQREMSLVPIIFNIDLTVLRNTENLGFAINSAMAQTMNTLNFIGRALGAEQDTPLIEIFDGSYPSDDYVMITFPVGDNMQKIFGPNYPTAAYFTLTHGVRKAKEALQCNDCHSKSGILSKNKFLTFDGYDTYGNLKFREISNLQVLGYEGQILSSKGKNCD